MGRPVVRRRGGSRSGGRRPSRSLRAVGWLATGFAAGMAAAAVFALYINQVPIPFREPPTRSAEPADGEGAARTRRETLEFHETLLQRRAVPSADDSATDEEINEVPQPAAAVPASAPAAAVQERYYLQVGAFGDSEAAEALRGEIALLGSQSILRAGRANGAQIFRVWMGPYPSAEAAEETRAMLVLNGHSQVQLLKITDNGE